MRNTNKTNKRSAGALYVVGLARKHNNPGSSHRNTPEGPSELRATSWGLCKSQWSSASKNGWPDLERRVSDNHSRVGLYWTSPLSAVIISEDNFPMNTELQKAKSQNCKSSKHLWSRPLSYPKELNLQIACKFQIRFNYPHWAKYSYRCQPLLHYTLVG